MPGRHRSPPPALRTGWRWHTVAALAGLGILAPPVTLWAQAVAPDATAARSQVSTVTRAERTDAGPLVLPTVGVVAPAIESLYPTTENAVNRPVPSKSVRTSTESIRTRSVPTADPVAIPTPSDAAPARSPEPSDEQQPVAAEVTVSESSTSTSTETPPVVVPTPTADPIPSLIEAVPNE